MRFILSDKFDFHKINNLSTAVHAFASCILSFSIEETLSDVVFSCWPVCFVLVWQFSPKSNHKAPSVELKEPSPFATLLIFYPNSSVAVSSDRFNRGSRKNSLFMEKIVLVATTRTQKETSNTFDSFSRLLSLSRH